jgi:serine/threonine protein kinase
MWLSRWHADIKPDNILIVQGKFKLADPGFATFIRANKSDPDPKTILLGGTTTYGTFCPSFKPLLIED